MSGLCAAAVAFLTFWPSLGGAVVGERLARAQASPQFRDGHFGNDIPETPRTSAQSWDYFKRQMLGDEVRTPPAPCPRSSSPPVPEIPLDGAIAHLVARRGRD